ncbi:hypothetical protein LOK49_LG04G01245 [Camellia lanceoleosa]|uniref:Uncharacterized protein n=1 Tax=Camellia lanceoleosa TaxID=1840588 RepID=A0ACC0I5V7_9ERIC|nr:hypothetical protein LOK49_LG04G01245 [Camellia lanceoleosa]
MSKFASTFIVGGKVGTKNEKPGGVFVWGIGEAGVKIYRSMFSPPQPSNVELENLLFEIAKDCWTRESFGGQQEEIDWEKESMNNGYGEDKSVILPNTCRVLTSSSVNLFGVDDSIRCVQLILDVEEEFIMFYSQDWFTSDLPTLITTLSTQISFKFNPLFSILY